MANMGGVNMYDNPYDPIGSFMRGINKGIKSADRKPEKRGKYGAEDILISVIIGFLLGAILGSMLLIIYLTS